MEIAFLRAHPQLCITTMVYLCSAGICWIELHSSPDELDQDGVDRVRRITIIITTTFPKCERLDSKHTRTGQRNTWNTNYLHAHELKFFNSESILQTQMVVKGKEFPFITFSSKSKLSFTPTAIFKVDQKKEKRKHCIK